MFDLLTAFYHSSMFQAVFDLLYSTGPLWLPVLLCALFIEIWLRYVRAHFIKKAGSVLLEIKLPREISKSPAAMEVVLTALYQTGSASYIETYIDGKVRPWFSLELVSIEGQVKFFIWTQSKYKNLIEAQIYAQYPTVEIYEAEDYTSWLEVDPQKISMWGTNFQLTKADAYPIKTYVDYGLDQDPKEEFKIDPMTSVLEYLGSMRKGEHVWIQIIIQAHRLGKKGKPSSWIKEGYLTRQYDWTEGAKKELKALKDVLAEPGKTYQRIPTKGEAETMAAIERSMSKFPFETIIRGAYIAKAESFNSIGITGLIGSFRQYSSNNLNGFKLGKFTDFDYPWQDFKRRRRTRLEKDFIEAYKMRSFFQPPYKFLRNKYFILTTEELATIYHFPGGVAATPTIMKTGSKKAEPPVNLPI